MKKNKIYVNRELPWLKFNERVLEEAMDENVPLCERLSFLSIFQSNLEEFYMVRVGTLQDQLLLDEKIKDNKTGMTSAEQIDAIVKETRRLGKLRDKVYEDIMNEVGKYGLREVRFKDLNSEEAEYIERYFDIEIMPVLSPMIVGKKQSFPFMATGMVYAVVVMESVRGKEKIGIIPCNSVMTQKIVMLPEGNGRYMSVEEIILHFADRVFGSYNIKAKSLVKITRNADINVETINDEENNIEWSRTLEDAGCHVIYGIDGVKVHSKLCQIVRKNGDNIEYITQIGTGNYNENTAKLYTDLVLMTADARIGADVANVFRSIGVGEVAKPQENILVAPDGLQNRLIDMFNVMLNDNVKARKMMPDSTYVRVRDMKENTAKDAGSISISAQEMFMERTDI